MDKQNKELYSSKLMKYLIKIISIYLYVGMLLPLFHPLFLFGQSIAEKKANLKSSESDLDGETQQFLSELNKETQEIHAKIQHLYDEVFVLYQKNAPQESYKGLLDQINGYKLHLTSLDEKWRKSAARSNAEEGYGLWHAPDTTLEELIIDYGSQDYVYLIPPEVGSIRLSIDSHLPIPRACWGEMLELILTQNGVGTKTLNPYLKHLYLINKNHSHLRLITKNRQDLEILPLDNRISFVLSPEPAEVRRTFLFLERFINPNTTAVQALGRDILLIGPVGELQDLLRLYDFISVNRGEKEFRLLPIYKLQAEEMAKILAAVFDQSEASMSSTPTTPPPEGHIYHPPSPSPEVNGLKIIVLENVAQALFVTGTREEVRKAEEIVRNVENQIGGARDKVVYWYTTKHSKAEELADVLYRVYLLMIANNTGEENSAPGSDNLPNQSFANPPQEKPNFYQESGYVVNPAPAQPGIFEPTPVNNNRDNFIVDAKTGAIVMVVESDIIPKLKDLLRKLDVPKKMVQIETILFEKMLTRENSMGLNLLKIGDAACNQHKSGAFFNHIFPRHAENPIAGNAGVFEFFLSRKWTNSGIPAFDLIYKFLLNQDDIQINSNPSLLTVNQTPATIAINEDISINTGIFELPTDGGGVALRNSFTRAQYGITLSVEPTIHLAQNEEDGSADFDYVNLKTDVTFDTIHGSNADRPDVTRRHITSEIQIPDGESVFIGGLRRKVSSDSKEAIPFLGELPGIGKLFSINTTRDQHTEMFIAITPHIVKDAKEQLACLRQQLLCLRPGDIPYFLECVEQAHLFEKSRLMEGSMTLLFGHPQDRYYNPIGACADTCADATNVEYDGR